MHPELTCPGGIRLSAPTAIDVPALARACNDPVIAKWAAIPWPYEVSDAEHFATHYTPKLWAAGGALWLAHLDGELVGCVEIAPCPGVPGRYNLGYWVAALHRGRGYAAQIAREACRYAFGELGAVAVEWSAHTDNQASAKTAWKLGFTLEGVKRAAVPSTAYARMQLGAPQLVDAWQATLCRGEAMEPAGKYWLARPWPVTVARDPERLVRQFHGVYGLPIMDDGAPAAPGERVHMRLALVMEEIAELVGATYGSRARGIFEAAAVQARDADTGSRDLVEIADALGDLVYVTYGMALECGIPMDSVLAEIQASNLSKLGADGKPIYREDGKVLKGPGFFNPDIPGVLERAARERGVEK